MVCVRSSRRISGVSCSGRDSKSARVYKRKHRPGRVLPARPARWIAEARLTFSTRRRGRPDHGACDATRARPESTTATTPSMVTDDSATLVERITFRRDARRTAVSCSSGERSPCSGTSSRSASVAIFSHVSRAFRISPAPGRKTSTSPSRPSPTSDRTADATCEASGRSSGPGACSIATSYRLPSLRSTCAPRCSASGAVASVALMATTRRSGLSRPPQALDEGQCDVSLQVALVELVQHDGSDPVELRRRQELAPEHPLGDEPDARACARRVLEAHLVAHGAADALPQFVGDATRRHARREPARLEHHDLSAPREASVEQRPGHARRLAGTRGCLEHERRVRA